MKTFTTSKGFKFTRTETGWLDETSGIEWEVEFKTNLNQYEAEAWAKEKSKSLPTQAQFIEAEEHGIRELPEMKWKGLYIWSSSTPHYSGDACVFSGSSGIAYYGYRTHTFDAMITRCITSVSVDSELSKVERLKKAKALIKEAMELMEGIWE